MRAKTSSSSSKSTSAKAPAKAAPSAAAAPAKKHGVATARKSEPIIAMTTRQLMAKVTPEMPKKAGELPTPVASFVF